VRILVQCDSSQDPNLEQAPADVIVRPCELETDDLQQLRRILHTLVTSRQRNVVVDLSDVSLLRRTNVVAVLVGAARDARMTRSTVQVYEPPADGRRALFVAGIEEVATLPESAYEIVVGIASVRDTTPLAV
jgi:anti-anti-sigma regulatory factor